MSRQVITIVLDKVSTAEHVETIVHNGLEMSEADLMDSAREAIEDHEGFEYLHDDRVSDIVDRINSMWDNKVHDILVNALNGILMEYVDLDEIDMIEFDETQCFDGIPGIDVGALEEEFKNSRIKFIVEWKLRMRFGTTSMWSVSSESNDYFVMINDLPEV